MDWNDLRLFLALARTGRMGSAAKLVGQDATTISRRVQRLERDLQTTLFEQNIAGYSLTESGLALLDSAESMETSALEIQESVGSGPGGTLSGALRISVSEGFGSRILATQIPTFTNRYPRIQVNLIASTGFLNPSRREADLAVMLARPKKGPLITRKLTDYRLGLYAHRAYLYSVGQIDRIEDLYGKPLIGYVPDLIYAPELRYLDEVDPKLEASSRSSSINAQAEMIDGEGGCGILPCFIGDSMPNLVRVLPDAISIERTFWLVVHRDVRRIARVARFVDWLDETVKGLQPLMLGRVLSV